MPRCLAARPERERRMASGPILIIEDNSVNALILRTMLSKNGYDAVVARDGFEGIALAEELRPPLILMDIQMPRMDGFAAADEIRRRPCCSETAIHRPLPPMRRMPSGSRVAAPASAGSVVQAARHAEAARRSESLPRRLAAGLTEAARGDPAPRPAGFFVIRKCAPAATNFGCAPAARIWMRACGTNLDARLRHDAGCAPAAQRRRFAQPSDQARPDP